MTTSPWHPICHFCNQPLKLQRDNKYVYCRSGCPGDGVLAGTVVGEAGQPARGLPRPVNANRSVPWVTPVIGHRVAWIALNDYRLDAVHHHWLCQVCGDPLDPEQMAWVAVSQGEVAAGGAMHQDCLTLARAECPALRDESFVFTDVQRADQARGWRTVIDRLRNYERCHGSLPRVLSLLA